MDTDDEPVMLTFFDDVRHIPRIGEVISSIRSNVQRLLTSLTRSMGEYFLDISRRFLQ